MSVDQITDQDVLYVKGRGDSRTLILKELSKSRDYVRLRDMAKSIKMNPGTVNYHCKGLEKRSLVKIEIAVGETNVKITEKGISLIAQLTRKQGANKT